jgi:secondary thiamine-phosphate synthase enzyme
MILETSRTRLRCWSHADRDAFAAMHADPEVMLDLRDFFERLVPEDEEDYRHTAEGPDDMTSHIRSTLTATSLSIPLIGGRLSLGTWQGLYLFEHRTHPHHRRVVLQLMGE